MKKIPKKDHKHKIKKNVKMKKPSKINLSKKEIEKLKEEKKKLEKQKKYIEKTIQQNINDMKEPDLDKKEQLNQIQDQIEEKNIEIDFQKTQIREILQEKEEMKEKKKEKKEHKREKKEKYQKHPAVSTSQHHSKEQHRTFANSFYSQNDLFKSTPKQTSNQQKSKNQKGKQNHKGKKNQKGKHNHKGKKNQKEQKKENIPLIEMKIEMSPNETNIKKPEMVMKDKSAENIYKDIKEDRRKLLFISYLEFLIRNHIRDLHYYKIRKGDREDDYILVSHLLEENPKYGKMWEKQLYKKIYGVIGSNPESYWILEVFTGKTYKGSSSNRLNEEKEKYQNQFIQTLKNPELAEPFFQQIIH